MNPILKPAIGICLGMGLAIASVWCLKQITDEAAVTRKESSYSLADLANEAQQDFCASDFRSTPIEPNLLPNSSLIVQQASAIPQATRIQDDDILLAPSSSADSSLSGNRTQDPDLNESSSASSSNLGLKEVGRAELAHASRSPIQNTEPQRDLHADPSVVAIPRAASGHPASRMGIQANPYFQSGSPIQPRPPTKSSISGSDSPPERQPLETSLDLDIDLEVGSDSTRPAHNRFEPILSDPIQFARSPQAHLQPDTAQPLRLSESVALRAVQHIEYGKTLARRGAKASAKQEFIAALSVIAQDFDSQIGGVEFTRALRNGTLAMKESDDFVLGDSESQIGMDAAALVEAHQSGALSKEESIGLTPVQVLQRYYGYAQSQLELGVGKNVVSAEALYCLGRLHTLVDSSGLLEGKLDRAKAMVFHRASLTCDAKNYRSANELGVLLAEFGELNDSLAMLKMSLQLQPTPRTWENLAKLHDRLGQTELAELARVEYKRALANQNNGMIHWIGTEQFNSQARPETMVATVPTNPSAVRAGAENIRSANQIQNSESGSDRKTIPDRVKSWF